MLKIIEIFKKINIRIMFVKSTIRHDDIAVFLGASELAALQRSRCHATPAGVLANNYRDPGALGTDGGSALSFERE